MTVDDADEPLSFSRKRLAPTFELHVVTLPAGSTCPFDDAEWRDAIVVVVSGELELQGPKGARHRFLKGDLLALTGLRLRELHNPGQEPAVLMAVSRRVH